MSIKAKRGFAPLVAAIDFINPYIVLLSIAGLVLEYTALKEHVTGFNRIIDIIFILDFTIRIISFPAAKYFFRSYGWVDFLACIPGLAVFFQYGQYFGLFKVVRIGRFFKIIRVLRFLRIFSFLKKMKGDSVFIQERIMKIGVSVVLVFVAGLAVSDIFLTEYLIEGKTEYYNKIYSLSRNKVDAVAERDQRVVYYTDNLKLYSRDNGVSQDFTDYLEKLGSSGNWFIEVNFTGQVLDYNGRKIPLRGILADGSDIMRQHDSIMMILVLSLIGILVLIIFYVGYIFAKDMRIVQLVNDSFDAQDYWLLKEEAKNVTSAADADSQSAEDEDEIITLLKKAAEVADKLEAASGYASMSEAGGSFGFGSGLAGFLPGEKNPFQTEGDEALHDMDKVYSILERVENKIDSLPAKNESEVKKVADAAAASAVRIASRSIGEYILKIMRR